MNARCVFSTLSEHSVLYKKALQVRAVRPSATPGYPRSRHRPCLNAGSPRKRSGKVCPSVERVPGTVRKGFPLAKLAQTDHRHRSTDGFASQWDPSYVIEDREMSDLGQPPAYTSIIKNDPEGKSSQESNEVLPRSHLLPGARSAVLVHARCFAKRIN